MKAGETRPGGDAAREMKTTRIGASASGILSLEREAGFQHHLEMAHLSVLHMASGLYDLEPAQVPESLVSTPDGCANGILDAVLR
jgi:hypothetical protein